MNFMAPAIEQKYDGPLSQGPLPSMEFPQLHSTNWPFGFPRQAQAEVMSQGLKHAVSIKSTLSRVIIFIIFQILGFFLCINNGWPTNWEWVSLGRRGETGLQSHDAAFLLQCVHEISGLPRGVCSRPPDQSHPAPGGTVGESGKAVGFCWGWVKTGAVSANAY